ncbi:MAG: 1-deoxy-D-xylulose-5-phosphate reductoisomerase [Bacteroidia bacterium]|nr:1-deoxy-D-xylulose-5-phosphate reductoisomerase [Bacteroidia bacterium]MDW8015857.1 1-deoxy-D-xylulose-5-phosphate reductoisomerase [Bacteroidia bacterium]
MILGASGSIGQQALSLLAAYPEHYQLVGISVHRGVERLLPWIEKLRPQWLAITDPPTFQRAADHALFPHLLDTEGLYQKLQKGEVDVILNSIVGSAGFWASWHALQNPHAYLALANKETLVFGGQWLAPYRHRLIPVDSEHSALFQCLRGETQDSVEKLILTASGGPFRGKTRLELQSVHPSEALIHPVWKMGPRITVDSATLMNKALELIEAYWLFGVPVEKIEVWVHPQCIVHSLVLFRDGTFKAQLGLPDMRLPILYALSYPDRFSFSESRWNPLVGGSPLTFEPVDEETFPTLGLARLALHKGGAAPALLNAADEMAVEAFLRGQIRFLDIFKWLEWSLEQPEAGLQPENPEELEEIEYEFRRKVVSHFLGIYYAK